MRIMRQGLRLLDRHGLRSLLARIATWHARRSDPRVRVFFDSVWMHEIDGFYWADSRRFTYHGKRVRKWIDQTRNAMRDARDFWFYLYEPKAGGVIIDIGAGNGIDIPTFSQAVGQDGRVLAVEAHPDTFALLERMVHWNHFNNVKCVQKAILGNTGKTFITNSAYHTFNVVTGEDDDNALPVSGTTLDELCSEYQIQEVALLKMNIEGAEREAIQGMERIIKCTRYVCIACHDFRAELGDGDEFRTRTEVSDYLVGQGFKLCLRNDSRTYVNDHVHGWNPQLVARPPILGNSDIVG